MIYLNVFDWFFHQPLKNYEVPTTQPVTRGKKLNFLGHITACQDQQ